jgi:transposase
MSKHIVLKQSLGLDVSKNTIHVCFAQQEISKKFRIMGTRKFANTVAGLKQMETWLRRFRKEDIELHLLMEATGVYYEAAAFFFKEQGYRVSVALPNKTKAYARSLNYKSKTDVVDAKILAQMALERDMAEWNPAGQNMRKIKLLCRERVELLQLKTATSNRLHARNHAHQPEKASLKRAKDLLIFLQKQITETEKAIADAVTADAEISAKVELLCSIQGVGLITAATIIGETNGFVLFKNKGQLVCYAGYDVVENQSGTSLHGKTRISKKGNAFIRRALHFPALSAVKHEPTLRNLYDRVFDSTRIKMKAVVAVQRKLLVLMYTLYKKDEKFDPNFQDKQKEETAKVNRQEHQSVPA